MEEWTKTAEDMMKAGTLFCSFLTGERAAAVSNISASYIKTRELGMIITIIRMEH